MSTYSLPTGDFVTSTLNGAITSSASTATIGTGLTIPASNGVLTIDYDSTLGLGVTSGPETISYSSYTSGTGALTGIVRGLAGTTGVAHSNGASVQSAMSTLHLNTVTANTLAITNAVAGWVLVSDTWTYASASTITVPTDATTTYSVGDKIRFKQGAGYKYGIICTVAATLLTIIVNTDYTVANAAITDVYYSKVSNPFGFPASFVYTPAFTNVTVGNATLSGSYSAVGGRIIKQRAQMICGTTTNVTGVIGITPVAAITTAPPYFGSGYIFDNTSGQLRNIFSIPASSSNIQIYADDVSQAVAANYPTGYFVTGAGNCTSDNLQFSLDIQLA